MLHNSLALSVPMGTSRVESAKTKGTEKPRFDTMLGIPRTFTPGPGAFHTEVYRSIGARFAQVKEVAKEPRGKVGRRDKGTPGPGAYNPDALRFRPASASFTMGVRGDTFADKAIKCTTKPGPGDFETNISTLSLQGAYIIKEDICKGKDEKERQRAGKTPSAATYKVAESDNIRFRTAPAYSLYKAPRDAHQNVGRSLKPTPGPDIYAYQRSQLQTFGAGRVGPIVEKDELMKQKLASQRLKSPGPGDYTPQTVDYERRGFTFGSRYAFGLTK